MVFRVVGDDFIVKERYECRVLFTRHPYLHPSRPHHTPLQYIELLWLSCKARRSEVRGKNIFYI